MTLSARAVNHFSDGFLMEQPDRSEEGSKLNWTVYRQDDHGNRFIVATGLSRDGAERMVAAYEARGHKQHYWVESQQT